jgi:phage gpG-like protein
MSADDIDLFAGEKRVHEIKLAKRGNHESHRNELTVLVVAESQKEAAVKACDLQIEKRPDWHTDKTSWLHVGSSPLESAEWRQFINDTQEGVLCGTEVPV